MILSWSEHPAAAGEVYDAALWYQAEAPDVARRFAVRVQQSIDSIRQWPYAASLYRDTESEPQIRSKQVNGFPYQVLYIIRDNELIVVAYAHERRRPGYWRDRLHSVL